MAKSVLITLEDGRVFSIDAHKIAHDRAVYYNEADPETTYQEEYDNVYNDEDELFDWLFNNMDWYELDPVLIKHLVQEDLSKCDVRSSKVVDNA